MIEQVQETSVTAGSSSDLHFNHPVKELIWCVDATDGTLVAIGSGSDTYKLKLNGHDRFAERDWRYFSRSSNLSTSHWSRRFKLLQIIVMVLLVMVLVYSFALEPEEHQPSGTCNFSRIDNAQLVQSSGANATKVYAVNYNVLRIMSGMGGLAYSN